MRTRVSARAMERTAYLPKTQCRAVITAPGGPEVLRFKEGFPVAAPGPDEVLIHVAASGVNRHDCNQRRRGPSLEHSDVPGLASSASTCPPPCARLQTQRMRLSRFSRPTRRTVSLQSVRTCKPLYRPADHHRLGALSRHQDPRDPHHQADGSSLVRRQAARTRWNGQ
jgi:hypothetical protein